MATDNPVPSYPDMPPSSRPPRRPDKEDDHRMLFENRVFATQRYIPWFIGSLRLGDNPDFSRVERNQGRVLVGHNSQNPIGRVLRAWHDRGGQVFRSNFEIPKIDATRDARERIEADLMRDISVGARLNWDALTLDNADEDWESIDDARWTAHEWIFVEQSMTPIPADGDAGLDRVDVLDLLREDEEIVVLGAGQAAMHQRTVDKYRPHLEHLLEERRKEPSMVTPAITDDAIKRIITQELERSESLAALTALPNRLDKVVAETERITREQMEFGQKLHQVQFGGSSVLQLSNWKPGDHLLNVGTIMRMTAETDLGLPKFERDSSSLEESFMERAELAPPDRSTVARVPFAAIQERNRQRNLMRASMSDAAGSRPTQVNVIDDAGLLMSDYSPILAQMQMRDGLRGNQEVPYWTAQGGAAGAAEGAAIPIETWTLNQAALTPISIGSAFDLSSSLTATDPSTFENLIDFAIQVVCYDQMTKQILVGGGSTAKEIAGLWGRVVTAHQHSYGATQADFDRSDVLTTKNLVDLAKTGGGPGQWILSTSAYQLAESKLRGGPASSEYLLEMGQMESRMAHHFADFTVSGITDPALFVKLSQCVMLIWGDSFQLQEIPVRARKNEFKMVVEANLAVIQPDENIARFQQT